MRTFTLRGVEAPERRCMSLAKFEVESVARRKNRKTNPNSTDPSTLAGGGAVTAHQDCLDLMSVDKLISRINISYESVSLCSHARKCVGPRAAGVVDAKKFN